VVNIKFNQTGLHDVTMQINTTMQSDKL